MKKSIILISSALLLIAGCNKEQLADPAVQNEYDGPVTIVGATYEQYAPEGETKASFDKNGNFGWESSDEARFELDGDNNWTNASAQNITQDKSRCTFTITGTLSNDMVAVLPSDLSPQRYTDESTNDGLKVKIPASRAWEKDQSYATMIGFGTAKGQSYIFSHLCGLAKVTVNGVPQNARKFVFKTKGFKISGYFEAGKINSSGNQIISTAAASPDVMTTDDFTEDEETYSLTFASNDISSNDDVMEFNVPLPCGTYSNGFAFCFKDEYGEVIYNFAGSASKEIVRAKRIILPTINISGGGGEGSKTIQNVPANHNGDFYLADAKNVLVNIPSGDNPGKTINFKYYGTKPEKLEIHVVGDNASGKYEGTISGNLPETHVDFTEGEIANVEMTTSASTFEIAYPAVISTKLTVTGGNVKVKGAQVAEIEVAADAVASKETKAPVQIVVDKANAQQFTAPAVTAKANVIVAPAADVTVKVTADDNVKVAKEGAGNVTDKNNQPINTKAAAQIDDIKYITLADAIAAAPKEATTPTTITLLDDVADGAGIFLAAADKKDIVIDLNNKTYTAKSVPVGSATYETQAFHFEKDNTVVIKDGTLNVSSSADEQMKMLIQNYCNLTLTNVAVNGTNLKTSNSQYVFSNNCGTIVLDGNTSITAPDGFRAFDVCKYNNGSYDYPAPTVKWESTGTVSGIIELSGGTLELNEDLCVNAPVYVVSSKTSTLNLNGKKLYNTSDIWGKGPANKWFELIKVDGGKLTINDISNGSVAAKQNDCYAVNVINDGSLEINGGAFKGNISAVQVDKGTATINGGYFEQQQTGDYGDKFLLNCVDANYKAETAKIIVKGGSFKGFDPANNAAEGAGTNFVAEGYTSTEDNGVWTVSEITGVAKIGSTQYGTLADAIAAVQDNEEIELIVAVTDAKGITVPSDKNFTVNFGGKTYTCASDPAGSTNTKNQVFQLLKNSTITFKNGTIKVADSAKDKFRFIIQNYANLTLEDMVLDGTNLAISDGRVNYTVSNNYGTVVFKGGTKIKAAATKGVAFDVCKSNDTVNYPEPPTVTVTSGTIEGQVEVTGGTLVVEAGTFKTTGARRTSDANHQSPTLLVSSGDVTVKGGSFTSEHDVAVRAEGGTVTLNNGTFSGVEGAVCFPGAGATINIVGGTYTASDNAVLIGQGSAKEGNANTVNISGGTFTGKISSPGYIACGIYAPWKDIINVTGGTFNITNGAGVVARAGVVTIDGGIFNCTGTTTGKVGDKAVNLPCECLRFDDSDPNYPAKDASSKIIVKKGTFSDLSGVQYVADEGTYKLANAVTLANPLEINSGKTFSIDLNGKTLTGRTNIKHGNVTFQNGTIETTGNVQALNVYGSSESSVTNYSVVTIASGVTVNAGVYAVCVFGATAGTTGYGAVANIAGTINTTGDEQNGAVFVSGNLGVNNDSEWAVSSKNAVNIQSTAKIRSNTDAAVALNGSATVTVASGAELTGATAIAAKRGKLIVNGGTITGTMDPGKSNPTTYMNGTEMTGSAVSATASYKADGPLSVEIKDGTFTSKAYTILNNHDGCEFKISGGNFTTTMATNGIAVYARLGSVNITGGEFINNSNSEATLHVGCPAAVEKGLQPTLTISGSPIVKNNADGPYTWGQQGSAPLTVNMANELTYKAVSISGGEYHGQKPEKDDSWTEGATHKGFLASGATISGENNVWTVSANQN